MLSAAFLLALQPAPATEPVPEIVVIGNLRSVQVRVGQDQEGSWHCSMNKSTGRPKLDHSFCKAVTKCVRKGAGDQEAVESCIRDTRGRLVRKVERAMQRKSS
ncbi:MAG: hypothetical protein SXU28_00045 [Pseudomonadota bacterium]|nr:hypothetical protein [Pseudomonadota bacterium]